MQIKKIENMLKKFNLKNQNFHLFLEAFTHSTYKNEKKLNYNNYQRLELLGDSVIQLIVTHYLYEKHPNYDEGDISKARKTIVKNDTQEKISESLHLLDCCFFGKGINTKKDFSRIKKDVFESFVGAIFLSEGLEKSKKFLKNTLIKYVEDNKLLQIDNDYKSKLQEIVQKLIKENKIKKLDNLNPIKYFEIKKSKNGFKFNRGVKIFKTIYGNGKGESKIIADQEAAKKAILKIEKNFTN